MGKAAFAWPVVVEIKVPWRDLDAAGHVNNANYFSYFETARVEAYFRMRDGRAAEDLDIILARTACDFRSPATLNEVLQVSVTPSAVGRTSFALRYEVREKRTGRLVVEGDSVQVMFDYASQQKKPLPEDLRAKLEAGMPPTGEQGS